MAFAIGGGVAFAASLAVAGYAYVMWWGEPAGVWSILAGAAPAAANVLLFTLFALHHSVLARTGAKARVEALVPAGLERSVYVWTASLLFAAVCLAWRPVPGVLWSAPAPWREVLAALQIGGVLLTVRAATRIDPLDLAGIRQALGVADRPSPELISDGLYRLVRHPIYLAWLLMVWPAPTMTGTRLAFAAVSTAYLAVAIPFEERELVRSFGSHYIAYRRRVRWRLLPFVF